MLLKSIFFATQKSPLRAKTILFMQHYAMKTDTYRVTVGMPVTQHPPYRSVREVLPHTAPTSGNDVEISDLEKDVQF